MFADTYGLAAIGSTKTGSMQEFEDFYTPLGEGKNLGESFEEWFISQSPYTLDDCRWFYGMTLLGYPTLCIGGSQLTVITINTSGLVSCPATIYYVEGGVDKTATTYDTWNGTPDYGSTLSITSIIVSSTELYYTTDTTSWTVTEPATYWVTYHRQFRTTISVTGLSPTNYATLTYYSEGSPATFDLWDSHSFNGWIDAGSTATLSNSSSASTSTHRWYTETNSWVINDASSRSATYWEQFKPNISVITAGTGHTDLDAANYVLLTYQQFGFPCSFNIYDAHSFNGWIDIGSTATLSNPSSASTSTHRWYTETTSWVINDASSRSATYYEQFKPTVILSELSPSHPTTVTFMRYGEPHSLTTSTTWSEWADIGSTLSISNPVTVSSTERYYSLDTTSWVVNSALTQAVNYFHQFKAAITPTGLNPSHPATINVVQCGTINHPTTYALWSGWADSGSTLGIDSIVTVSLTERYHTSDTPSWTVTEPATHSVTYYQQFKPTICVTAIGANLTSTNYATLSYYCNGSPTTFELYDAQSFNDWIDIGSTANLSNPSSASISTHRWYTETTSWIINNASSRSATYWEQYKATVVVTGLSSSHPATLTVEQNGLIDNPTTYSSWSDWTDIGSTLTISNPVTVSSTERCYSSDTISWVANSALMQTINYLHQFKVTIATTGLDPSHPATITFMQYGAINDSTTSTTWNDWVDSGSTLSISSSVEGDWTGDWSTGDAISWTVNSAISAIDNYHRSHTGIYILVGAIVGGIIVIGVIIFMVRRRKARCQ